MNVALDGEKLAAAGIEHVADGDHHTFTVPGWKAPVRAFSTAQGLNLVPLRDAGHRRLLTALGLPWTG